MHFKVLLNISRVLNFNMVSNSYMQMIRVYADSVRAYSSKEQCKYKYMYGLIREYADSGTVCSSKEWCNCMYRSLEGIESVPLNLGKCKKLRNTSKLRFQGEGNRETRRLRKGKIATRI